MKINYPAGSPYAKTQQLSWRLGRYEHRAIPADPSDTPIDALDPKYHNRPDLLADDLYGTPAYWWVFQVRNPNLIRDAIWDLVAGMQLIAPGTGALAQIGL